MPIAIGTSMFIRPWRRRAPRRAVIDAAGEYERRDGDQCGNQWNRSRVGPTAPDQTETDSSMMFASGETGDGNGLDQFRQRAVLAIVRTKRCGT